MGKLVQSEGAVLEGFQQQCHASGPPLAVEVWREPLIEAASLCSTEPALSVSENPPGSQASSERLCWDTVVGLQAQQRRALQKITSKGVFWKHPNKAISSVFTLQHGGDVEADGNCLFTAFQKAMMLQTSPQEVRNRTVRRFTSDYKSNAHQQQATDSMIKNLYFPDLSAGWGVHVVQEIKLLARKSDREAVDTAIQELVQAGMIREVAAETVYKERCMVVSDGPAWAKYMSIGGNGDDEHDIVTLQYTQDGLLSVDENREGRAAAFGDDIAIESLATEFEREIFVVQAHGTDAMVDEDNCVFFLPHHPRGEIQHLPVFLFMKGTGWCGAGADHYEPLIAHVAPTILQEKAAVAL